ncbi:MAG: phenylalanine 4-monooxygenase [Acidobacteriales bacterium]|nr:phenylalanine 4-monooxygenase [Terriglobales bacterium]
MNTINTVLPPQLMISQCWAAYTPADHDVWRTLCGRRMAQLEHVGSRVFLEGMRNIGLEPDRVPRLEVMNARLAPRTGWRAIAVTGYLPAPEFFACLARREFPTTVTLRPPEQLDYLPEPDIFHDVFGHVPMHADPVFADFLQRFGAVAAAAREEAEVRRLTRLFWFTVEFGLIREGGETKVYGSGLISSGADCANALSEHCERIPFSLDAVMGQEFEIDHVQPRLFVVENYQELFEAVERL